MADSYLGVEQPAVPTHKIDSESLTVGANTVERQRTQIAGATATQIAAVDATNGLDVDVTRVIPGTSATHLGKAIDAVAGATDTGVVALVVRDDALATLTPADGDYDVLRVDSTGRLHVIASIASSQSLAIGSALPAGTNAIGKLASNDGVDIGNVDVTTIVPGVGATNLGIAQDDAVSATKVGVLLMAKQSSAPANVAGTNGDAEALQMSAGKLWVLQRGIQTSAGVDMTDTTNNALKVSVVADSVGSATDTDDGTVATGQSTIALTVDLPYEYDGTNWVRPRGGHTVAHDAADAGNPEKIGAVVETSPKGLTPCADGDRTNVFADADGVLMVKVGTSGADLISERVANTDGASTAFSNFSAVASTFNYVTAISVYNSSATPGHVDFRDGTAGAIKWTMALPAGGGSVLSSSVPLFKTSANTALAFDVSSALSTVYISASGYQSKV